MESMAKEVEGMIIDQNGPAQDIDPYTAQRARMDAAGDASLQMQAQMDAARAASLLSRCKHSARRSVGHATRHLQRST